MNSPALRLRSGIVATFFALLSATIASAQQQYSIGNPSNDQQYMLELINRARANADAEAVRLGMPNRQEGPPGIDNGSSYEPWTIQNTTQPLSWNAQLQSAAQNHADTLEQADHFFTGTSPHNFGGTTPEQRVAASGYQSAYPNQYNGPTTQSGFFPGAENVAEEVGQGGGPYTGARLTEAVVRAHDGLYIDEGVQGRGHRNTTTLAFFREVGVGITAGTDVFQGQTYDTVYVVQNFGRHTNDLPFITGVVYNDANGNNFYDPGEGIGGVRVDVVGANFFAVSSASGGYSVPVPGNGTYTVTFSGLEIPTGRRIVTVSNLLNVKLDYIKAATLANISTRMLVGTDENVLIGGFIITGNEPKKVMVRALGPSLAEEGVNGALQDPTLDLIQGDTVIAANDNWRDSQQTEIEALPPKDDREAAIVRTLNPGAYTAVARGKGNTTGVGLVELYDFDLAADARLANIATRGFVQTGTNIMIAGMIVVGDPERDPAQRVLVRAIGPSLTVDGKLADPTLELVDGNGNVLRANDNWRTDQQAEIQASQVAPTNDLESALIHTLPHGNYTATVRGVGDTTGIAVVEVYALSN